jgi:hypothetical protein
MCWRPLRVFLRKPSGLSCEIVSDLRPNPLSHDWHVQPSCQRPNRDPPERREFSPVRRHTSATPTVLETLQTYRAAQITSTHASHRISTGFPHRERPLGLKLQPVLRLTRPPRNSPFRSRNSRHAQRYGLPPGAMRSIGSTHEFSAREGGRQKIGKRTFGGPYLEGTLQKPISPWEIMVSEFSPVAGTT